jgi:hypothetical protein
VLLGFKPQWRGQPFGTFRVIFNAIASAPIAQGATRTRVRDVQWPTRC